MKNRRDRVAVVLPAFDEAPRIGKAVREARKQRRIHRVVVVDDGSRDATAAVARRAGATVLRHSRNRGIGAALRTGFAWALRRKFGVILVMAGDDQDRGREIPRLLDRIAAGYDFVQGSRWMSGGRVVNIPLFRRVTTIIYSLVFTAVTRHRITDGTNGFRAVRARVLAGLRLDQRWLDRYELEPYVYYQAVRRGYRVAEVPITKSYPRSGVGYTKMRPLRDWWSIFRPLILLPLGLKR